MRTNGKIIELDDYHVMVVTCVDYHLERGEFKIFRSFEEAESWLHEVSKKQLPEWHRLTCPKCQ